jgi:class 3 adenylate cyclase/pimeloyl-ACP methyl ester carboxylesterase
MKRQVRYADSAGCSIAYEVIGHGSLDVVFVPGLVSHLDLQWSDPVFAHTLERLGRISRLIVFDNRGVGLSDRVDAIPTLDERVADVRSVMNSVGSERAILLGHCNGGPAAALFAATFPEQALGLILCSTFAKGTPDADHPGALPSHAYELASEIMDHWGEGRSITLWNPSREAGGLYRRLYATFERAALSKGMARASLESTRQIDVTSVLEFVQAPTLVLHCTEDFMSIEAGRYLASRIPNARFVELNGADHVPFSGNMSEELMDEIERFVIGGPAFIAGRAASHFGTILFTDIVDSTRHLSSLGDGKWRQVLTNHELAVRDRVDRHGGECVKSTGDGVLITFDSAYDAVRCADRLADDANSLGIAIRAALHAGAYEHVGPDVVGLAVHTASRILGHASADEILVSGAVRDLVVGSGLRFAERESLPLKGFDLPCVAYALVRESDASLPTATWTGGPTDPQPIVDSMLVSLARLVPGLARAMTRFASSVDTYPAGRSRRSADLRGSTRRG